MVMRVEVLPGSPIMKLAIVGSRMYSDPGEVAEYVMALPPDTVIVSGGAPGVDSWAALVAEVMGFPEAIVHRPDWKAHGKGAGFIRNRLIVRDAHAVVAFWDGRSPGTRDTILAAEKAGKLFDVYLNETPLRSKDRTPVS